MRKPARPLLLPTSLIGSSISSGFLTPVHFQVLPSVLRAPTCPARMRLRALELPAETGPGVPPPSSQGGSLQNTMSTRSAGTAVEALQSPHLFTRPIMDSLIPSANIYDASYVPGTILGARSWDLPYVREKG